jgi:hypothetical protein
LILDCRNAMIGSARSLCPRSESHLAKASEVIAGT